LRAVLREALRLYPPAWILERKARQEDVLGGYHVTVGTTLAACQWVVHRRADLWERREDFWPDRFLQDDPARPAFAYFPFGGGPRGCIGEAFAMLEAEVVLSVILRSYRFRPTAALPEPVPGITLRPRAPVAVRLERRAASPALGRLGGVRDARQNGA
jgi:cytochrome P450